MRDKLRKAAGRVIYNYLSLVLSQFICMPLSILYLSMLTRVLGPGNFGHFTIFLAVTQLFFCIFVNWTRNSIIRFGSEAFVTKRNLGEVIGSQGVITFYSFIFILITMLLIKGYLQRFFYPIENIHLWIILYLMAYILCDFTLQFLKVKYHIRSYATALILRQVIALILFGVMFINFRVRFRVLYIIIVEIVSYLFILGIFFKIAFSGRAFFSTISWSKKKIKEMLAYSWPVMIITILGYCLLWADVWMIKYFLTYKDVGQYQAAHRLIQLATNAIMPLSIIGLPLIVSLKSLGNNSLIIRFITRIVPQLCFFWGLVILILLYISKDIIYLLFGENFLSSLTSFRILLVGLSFQILPFLYTCVLQAYDWTKRMALIAAISVTANLFLNFILIPKYDIAGAAISKTCSFIICSLLYTFSVSRCLKIQENNCFVYTFLLTPLLALPPLYFLKENFFVFLVIIILCGLNILIVKKNKIFSKEDWVFWDRIKMPIPIRFIFKKIYSAFV
jgi:O-antigen/teichoic acid export membrane protein